MTRKKETPTGPCVCGKADWPGRDHQGMGRRPLTRHMCPECALEHKRKRKAATQRERNARLKPATERPAKRKPKAPAIAREKAPPVSKPRKQRAAAKPQAVAIATGPPVEVLEAVVPKASESWLLSDWTACPVCWRKHKGPGRYCDRHEAIATAPEGLEERGRRTPYTRS